MLIPRTSSVVLSTLILFHAAGGTCGEPGSTTVRQAAASRLLGYETVSESFRARSLKASASIPENVWQGVQQLGWRVQLAEFVLDVLPAFRVGNRAAGPPAAPGRTRMPFTCRNSSC